MKKIVFRAGENKVVASLDNNMTALDFYALLPISLTLKDFMGTEKISQLPRQLSTEGAPKGCQASKGDITYYAPWGNLAIFYQNFSYADGLIKLGHIDDLTALLEAGTKTINIESVS